MVAPVPAALVRCADHEGNSNLITIGWTGTVNTHPPMAYISVRPERFSHHMIEESGEFVINLTTVSMMRGVDTCGVRSGRDVDKWALTGFTKGPASVVHAPIVVESPVNIECKVTQVLHLGSHDMFLAEVVAVQADEQYFDERGAFDLNAAGLAAYVHGSYVALGDVLGTFGYSVRKKPAGNKKKSSRRSTARKENQK